MRPENEEEDFPLLDFPPVRLEDELFPPEDRPLDFEARELLPFRPVRDPPVVDARLELLELPRERPPLVLPPPERPRGLLDDLALEDLEPERLLLLGDFLPPADLLPEDLPPLEDDLPRPDDLFELADFELLPPLDEDDLLPLDDLPLELPFPLLEDLVEPNPEARFAAPAA